MRTLRLMKDVDLPTRPIGRVWLRGLHAKHLYLGISGVYGDTRDISIHGLAPFFISFLSKLSFALFSHTLTQLQAPISQQPKSAHVLTRWENDSSSVLEGRDDVLNEEDVESLHESLEEVEENNEAQVAEDVDQKVEDNDKEPKGMKIVHSDSSEMDDQLGALDGVLNKKEKESLELNASKSITCWESEFKTYSENLHKLHNNRAKVGALILWKHLGPWQFQEKVGRTNQVWDPGKSLKNHHFWGVIACVEVFRDLVNLNWDPLEPTKSKHWWGFKDEFKHKPP
ncbi:hypothetical protein PIB30_085233 [Stylosanthes scabra]|uniref:Uncharacterized protein n=1 Tax=Stylosanthes scabra TaxID=79078 RepID=A0ABU6ZRK3_9FABA|nr:hypothetical protein [Stylosanthes scabra]